MTATTARDTNIAAGIQELVVASGTNSYNHGFHEDWPVEGYPVVTATGLPASDVRPEWVEEHKAAVRRAIAEKLALIHEEVSEALGEIRSGRDPLEVYFVDENGALGEVLAEYEDQHYGNDGVTPLLKPEGFLVELADAMIRIADLAYLVGDGDGALLAQAQRTKHEYNATRPFKHGRKF